MSRVAIRLENISKRYGDVVAAADVSFEVRDGEFMSLLGPSGCGKTTVLSILAGFVKPDSGSITLLDQRIDEEPIHRRNMALVFQNYALFPHLTVFENIAYGLRVRKLPGPDIGRLVGEVLHLVRLPDITGRYPRQLSGGQQQRVALARALVLKPKVLLLDEPLSNLDAKLREDMRVELRDIQRAVGITTVFVTHDIQEAFSLSDRVAVMRNGRIEQVSAPAEIYERPSSEYIARFIGRPNLFDGEALSVDAQTMRVRIGTDQTFTAPRIPHAKAGCAIRVLVWPEKIAIRRGPSGNGSAVPGTVARCTYLGSHIDYLVDTGSGGEPVIVTCPNVEGNVFDVGDRVCLEWSPRANIVLHEDD